MMISKKAQRSHKSKEQSLNITTCSTKTNLEELKDYEPESKINSKIARIQFVFSEVINMPRATIGGTSLTQLLVPRATPKVHIPYGMFLTRLFRHVIEHYPHLDNGIYNVVNRVMRPFALKQTRRPRSDREKARHSVSSTFAHHYCGSSSHKDKDDEYDGASRASTPSPTTYLNSLEPLNYQ
ncbi:hypothetical protein Tco_0828369, partial [Tanacetum coccineum]